MSRPTFINSTVVYNDHSTEYNIDARGNKDIASVIRACKAEDVTPEPSSVSPETIVPPVDKESHSGKQLFCRITKAAYEKGVAQKVDNDLRSASISAPKLCKVIKLNEALDYLDTKDMHSTDLYVLLDEHYHLPFKIRTFQDYRSK